MAEITNEDIMKKLDKLDDYFKLIVDNQKNIIDFTKKRFNDIEEDFAQIAKNQQDICDLINKRDDDAEDRYKTIVKNQKTLSKDIGDVFGAIDNATNTITSFIG